ncbi:SagB/ThcOx family dehydrogenase [Desulfonatronum thioautotrophicum]|uniref:SagB/ThcOx family dehydrogenase n=1 Tax=Desulfonatronum thioautotrophicum TaxID=617001 RepID=UPI001ABF996A|nr:SagB/ThcOx family dehydrogenase [Desulfonatronum thioautotrophicum]
MPHPWNSLKLAIPLLGLLMWGFACHADQQPGGETMMSPEAIELPAPSRSSSVSLEETLAQRRSVRSFSDTPLTLAEIGQLLWAAQGISEPRRGLRTAPSAGATYPLEIDVVIGNLEGIAAGVYRYAPGEHALRPLDQERLQGDQRQALAQAGLNQSPLHSAPVTFAISAVHARTAARYGDRATRYVDMEVGHAAQNLSLQAVALGLGSVVIGAFNDREVASVLGLSSGESPLYLIPVGTPR